MDQNEYNSYDSCHCHCSSSCIRNEIIVLKSKIERMEEKLDAILQKMDNHIIKNCNKMGDHIDFVNNVYDTVKVPLHYISNRVQKMIGVTSHVTSDVTSHHDHRAHTSSNKIECADSNVNVTNN